MDTLQGSGSSTTVSNPQQLPQQTLLPQSNSLQGPATSQNLSNLSIPNLSVVPNCTQSCSLGVSTSAAQKTHNLSSGWVFGSALLVVVIIIGVFARRVLNS